MLYPIVRLLPLRWQEPPVRYSGSTNPFPTLVIRSLATLL